MKWTSASASHILVKNKLLANSIKSNIKNYNDFRELAKEYSVCPTHKNGGYIGYFVPGEMVSELPIIYPQLSVIFFYLGLNICIINMRNNIFRKFHNFICNIIRTKSVSS